MKSQPQQATATDDVNITDESQQTVQDFRSKGGFSTESNDSNDDVGQHVTVAAGASPVARSEATIDGDALNVPEKPPAAAVEVSVSHDIARRRLESESAVSGTELSFGLGGIALWFLLFTGGVLINSQPYRDLVVNSTIVTEWLSAYVMTILFWTVTNVGLLTCLAALIGAAGYRTRFAQHASRDRLPEVVSQRSMLPFDSVHYFSAIVRGFSIYALSFAGLFVLATDSLQNPDQGSYLRLAATMTIAGFYAGYDPRTFSGLLGRVKTFFETK